MKYVILYIYRENERDRERRRDREGCWQEHIASILKRQHQLASGEMALTA